MDEPFRDTRTVVAQLRDHITDLIHRENMKPGDRLPTESQLTVRFQVSRPTLREALKLMEQDGSIVVEHGRGRFVSATSAIHVSRPITIFESVSDMSRHYGYNAVNKVLSVKVDRPPDEAKKALKLADGETTLRLERLRFEQKEPIIYCVDYVPRRILPESIEHLQWDASLLDIMGECGQRPRMSAASVSSVFLPDDVVSANQLQDFGPALLISETCFNGAGEPVNYAMDYHRGSHFSFSFVRK